MSKKIGFWVISLVFVLVFCSVAFAAEPYPSREIELIVPFGTGGGNDLMSRSLAPKLTELLGKPVLVVNKPGASGTVGTALTIQRKPDGHTLMTISPSCILFAPHFQKLSYHPLKDITYIAGWVDQPYGIQVRQDAPWKTLQDLIDYAKKNPGKIRYASTGVNGIGDIYMKAIAKDRGIEWVNIPFAGDGTSIPALLGGHVEVTTMAVAWVPQAKAEKLRPLALFSAHRFSDFPDTPTLSELGFDYYMGAAGFMGVGAPKGLPEDILKKLENAFKIALDTPEFKQTVKMLSLQLWYRNSHEFTQQAEKGFKAMGGMVETLGLK